MFFNVSARLIYFLKILAFISKKSHLYIKIELNCNIKKIYPKYFLFAHDFFLSILSQYVDEIFGSIKVN